MKALVTGGAGFIGSFTVDRLVAHGYEVIVLDSLQSRVHPNGAPSWLNPAAKYYFGDVTRPTDLAEAAVGIDEVYHLAAYQDHQPDYHLFVRTNTESLARLFSLAQSDRSKYPFSRIIFASSQAACGEGKYVCENGHLFWPMPRSRDALVQGSWNHLCADCGTFGRALPMDVLSCSRPTTAYGVSKLGMEMMARALGPRLGITTVGMRYTHVLGPRNSVHNAYSGLARRGLLRIKSGEPIQLFEDGQQLFDVIDVRDVAAANVHVSVFDDQVPRVFNVGGPVTTKVADIASLLTTVAGFDAPPIVSGEFRYGDPRDMISDSTPLRKTGWIPAIELSQTLSDYVGWFDSQDWDVANLVSADSDMRNGGVTGNVNL